MLVQQVATLHVMLYHHPQAMLWGVGLCFWLPGVPPTHWAAVSILGVPKLRRQPTETLVVKFSHADDIFSWVVSPLDLLGRLFQVPRQLARDGG